jgi:cell division protein FtsQ
VAKPKGNQRNQPAEPAGLWHQPTLMNLLADVLIVLGVAGLAWASLTALQRLPVFPLREVVLTTAPKQVSAEQIAHTARSAVVGNFFTVDLEAARAAFEKLPWVRTATVRRTWPNGLSLTLEEHEAAARWRPISGGAGPSQADAPPVGGSESGLRAWGANKGDGSLVNVQGEVFVADLPENASALPRLSGPEGSAAEVLAHHAEFNSVLAGIDRRVEAVALSPRRAWQLKLDDGVAIELGRDQERHPLAERLARFVAHYESIKARLGAVRVADMRYPNGFALAGAERAARPVKTEAAGRKS